MQCPHCIAMFTDHEHSHTCSISARDHHSGCILQEEMILFGKAILRFNNRGDNSIIQSVNIWTESSLASQSEKLNRFSGVHQYAEAKDIWLW